MTGHDPTERIQDLLDGLLSPAEEADLRRRVAGDPEWARRYRQALAVHALLGTSLDVEPPADLTHAVLCRVADDRARRAARFRLPVRVEKTLVVAGTAGLAALVVGVWKLMETGTWAGRAAKGAVELLTGGPDAMTGLAASLARLDWFARLMATLSDAAGTVLTSSVQPLLVLALMALASTATVAYVLMRTEKAREGALSHVHLAI